MKNTSIVGWQIQALKAAHFTGLQIPGVDEALDEGQGPRRDRDSRLDPAGQAGRRRQLGQRQVARREPRRISDHVHLLDEAAHHRQRHVGLQQRHAHLAQHVLHVALGDAGLAAHRLDGATQAFGEGGGHGAAQPVSPGRESTLCA